MLRTESSSAESKYEFERVVLSAKQSTSKVDHTVQDYLGDYSHAWLIDAITSFLLPPNSNNAENKLVSEIGINLNPVH